MLNIYNVLQTHINQCFCFDVHGHTGEQMGEMKTLNIDKEFLLGFNFEMGNAFVEQK